MVKMTEESNTSVSIWWLYIGMFLCCTGFGLIPGAIFIVYWAIRRLEGVKLGNSYTDNYSVNIQDYHDGGNGGSGGSGGSGNGSNSSPKSNIKPKTKRPIKAIAKKSAVKKAVPINYVSNSNLERGK